MYYVYIILCDNGHYYTGYTNDLAKRYQAHCEGAGAKYTRANKPVKLAAHWQINSRTKSEPMKVEAFIKGLSRDKKEALISNPAQLDEMIAKKGR